MLNPATKYRLGEPVDYTSMYGYPKRRFPVYEVINDTPIGGVCVGHIKEEKVINEAGGVTYLMFYERNGWKKRGQQRFYTSCEAMILACGGQFAKPAEPVITNGQLSYAKPKKAVAKKPAAKKKTARKVALTSREKAAAKAKRMKKTTRRTKKAA